MTILLVEDSPGDVELTREGFEEAGFAHRLDIARNGEEALRRLHGRAPEERPDLILLDWNLPRKSGLEVLTAIKQDRQLVTIPVLVFSSSGSPRDVLAAYGARANCYIVKPVDYIQFQQVIEAVQSFWAGVAVLPPVYNL